jgi:flagellar hook-length control protein FliK
MQTTETRSPTLDPRPAPRRQDPQPRRADAFEAELATLPERDAPPPRPRDAERTERAAPERDDAPPARRRDEPRSAAADDARSAKAPAPGARQETDRQDGADAAGNVPGEDEAVATDAAEAKTSDAVADQTAMPAPPMPEPPAQVPPPAPPGQAVSAAVQAALAAAQQQQQQDQTAPATPPQGAVVAAAAVQAAGAAKAVRPAGGPGAGVPQPTAGETEATDGEGEGEGGEASVASEAAAPAKGEVSVPDAPKAPRAAALPQGAQPGAVDSVAQAAQAQAGAPGEAAKAADSPAGEAKERKVGLDAPAPGASPSEMQALRADIAGASTETVKVTVTPLPSLQPGAFGGVGQDMPAPQQAGGLAQAPQTPPTPVAMLPIEIGMRALDGQQRFEIRLSPETLGRIDVRLDIAEDGAVKAHIVVDRADTLGLLQRDSRTLERAFEQAGLKTGDGALQFSLGGQSQGGQNAGGQGQEAARRPAPGDLQERTDASARDLAAAIRTLGVSAGGLDIRI